MTTLHNNEVCVVFAEHTRVVVFFVEVDEHENMSVLLVTHDVIIDFDELFWTHFTRHLFSYDTCQLISNSQLISQTHVKLNSNSTQTHLKLISNS